MFYSHTYLKRNGRFGLIWLAATQSKVLNKRELHAVNISVTCSDILDHIPGQMSKGVTQHPRRFSLYLSSQLMYGSVRILQRQWEYLFLDVSALLRKCHPEVPSEIDLIMIRQDPVTVASCVPSSQDYDPFLGLFKESTADVESYLNNWDRNYVSKQLSRPSRPDNGSPESSVADPMDIRIRESDVAPIDTMLPGEQDLPYLDADNLALLDQSVVDQAEDVEITAEDMHSPQVSRILAATDLTLAHDLQRLFPPMEKTPGVRTSGDIPRTPQKPKRKRHYGSPDRRRRKYTAGELERGLATSADADREAAAETGVVPSPHVGAAVHHGHDWLQQSPPIELSPVTPSYSPIRKRKSHRLVIDQTTQMSRDDMKNNMLTSTSTTQPLVLPELHQGELFKEPASKYLKSATLTKFWARNCKFGLRVYDTETESSSLESVSSSLPEALPSRSVGHTMDETIQTEKSLAWSVERGRDVSVKSASFEGDDKSRSLIAPASDDSLASTSARKRRPSTESEHSGLDIFPLADLEQIGQMAVLHPWPEEQEQMVSPIPLPPDSDKSTAQRRTDESERSPVLETGDSPKTEVLRLVTQNLRTEEDWTTFRTICPPSSCNREQAARLFKALCCQAGQGSLYVRQDEPYSDIFIWLSAEKLQ